MRLWHMLYARIRSLLFRRRRERDLHEELQLHIERESEQLERAGLTPGTAHTEALRRFGGVAAMAEACRDARGRMWLDGLARDLRFALRSFRRTPLVALTIVVTVALGLGLLTVVFSLLNVLVFRVDNVLEPSELFAVERQRSADGEPLRFTHAQYETLLRETRVFSNAYAQAPDVDAWFDGRRMEGTLVTANFFDVLGVPAALGRTFAAGDADPGAAKTIVLSHRAWTRYFAGDAGILSRTVRINDTPVHVIGVMPDGFRGLMVAPPDFWAPLSLARQFHAAHDADGNAVDLGVIGRLEPDITRDQAHAQLQAWDARAAADHGVRRTATPLVLEPRRGTVPQPLETLALFAPLFFAFGLVLVIGCANVANLLFARAVARQREIGVRLAIGASRRRIVAQLFAESLLLALVAAGLGFLFSRLMLTVIVDIVVSTFPPDFGDIRLSVPAADWRVAVFLVVGAFASTLFFALAPALQATRLDLVRAVRGEVIRGARPGRVRDALVAIQVTGSTMLLVCAAIFLRSSWAAAQVDPGLRTSDTMTVSVLDESRRDAVLDVTQGEPAVASVAASWPGVFAGSTAVAEPITLGGSAGGSQARKPTLQYQFVSPEYFEVLGIDIVRGRTFRDDERSSSAGVAIVSDRVARELWPDSDAVGQILGLDPATAASSVEAVPSLLSRTAVVVGVAKDVTGFRLGGSTAGGTGVYVPTDVNAPGTSLTLRVHGDPENVRRDLVDRLAGIDVNMAEVRTLRTLARMEAFLLAIPFWLTLVLGTLALLLTLSGLFSVLSYLVAQRSKDIGVRIALGATRNGVGMFVLQQSARPVVLGLLAGAGLTGALGAVLLATPAAELIGSAVRLFDPVAYATSLLCIVAACILAGLVPALRATRIDPVRALRQD